MATPARRPVMLAITGDSASGKSTLAAGLADAIGRERCTVISVDDYHRHDRADRALLPFTALHPEANYVDIMEQHLQMLATGSPILKPVYDHATGTIGRPEYVEAREFVIAEGLLPLLTPLSRASFDVSVYLDPPEDLRHDWKTRRDCAERGYTAAQVRAELARREPDSAAYVRPQHQHADIVVRFSPVEGDRTILDADVLLRPTIAHPPLTHVLRDELSGAIALRIIRDTDGTPVDCVHVPGSAEAATSTLVQEAIWAGLAMPRALPAELGRVQAGVHSGPLAIAQLLLLEHLTQEAYQL